MCLVLLSSLSPAGAQSQNLSDAPVSKAQIDPDYPLWLGAGALVGALAFNLLAIGPSSLPVIPATVGGTQVVPSAAMAFARVYAGTSAVVGAILADRWFTSRS